MIAAIIIDQIIEFLQHEFFMVFGGLLFYFYLKFSISKNKKQFQNFRAFWNDQNDEVGVSVIGGLMFLVWDDETMSVVNAFFVWIGQAPEEPLTLERYYYLLVGPIVERVYVIYQITPNPKAMAAAVAKWLTKKK